MRLKSEDLIATARFLISRPEPEQTQADLKRAGSTAYYALFHELGYCCAINIIGDVTGPNGRRAWQQSYRALEHKFIIDQLRKKKKVLEKFPTAIQDFANVFKKLQEKRHSCDYDPLHTVTELEIRTDIAEAESALGKFASVTDEERRYFCVFVLFKHRNDPAVPLS